MKYSHLRNLAKESARNISVIVSVIRHQEDEILVSFNSIYPAPLCTLQLFVAIASVSYVRKIIHILCSQTVSIATACSKNGLFQ